MKYRAHAAVQLLQRKKYDEKPALLLRIYGADLDKSGVERTNKHQHH